MDLRSIINNEAGENSSSKQTAPVTPVQAGPPQQSFREYSHPPQASPGKHPSLDYSGPQHPRGPHASPSSYQRTYTGRPPPPPPIQAPPQHDLRSPAGSYSAQSPYRQTPTSSISSGQYPFPPAHQTPQSPAQHHQYPPSYQRDSYPQTNHPPSHLQHHNSQSQVSPAPQTPPIGMPGQPHPYLQHQRSQSSISNSTPTSAQSQQPPYYNQYPQDSPVPTTHFPPSQLPQNQRHQSQPGTPLGPPISQRQSSGGFTQPTSPYQQRGISQGPFANFNQTPPAPAAASIPRLSSTPSAYDSQRTSTSEQQRRSQSERERSLSVSPKTRVLSQPPGNVAYIQQSPYNNSAKRRMESRESSIEQLQRFEQHDGKPQVNGEHQNPHSVTSSPQQPARKRVRYTEPPIWAQSIKNKSTLSGAGNRAMSKVNGKQTAPHSQPQTTPSPLVKSETNGHQALPGAMNRPGPPSDVAVDEPSLLLGPWEQTIANVKPTDAMAKEVADWLFRNVVSRADIGELTSRGVEVEIEAKLGQLIDKDTGVRYRLPIRSEAVLSETNRIAFRSTMTEDQHKLMNNFLNSKVQETHPDNPSSKMKRVPIDYLHRHEKDEFFELPSSYNSNLPPAVQQALKDRNLFHHAQKLRISRDQKTNQVLGKIIKTRIADLDILFPGMPLDCRISVNFEMRFDGGMEEIMALVTENRQPDRLKDRMSYTQSHYQIDLTQVSQSISNNGMNRAEKEHELEIELSTSALREQGQRAASGQPHNYLALVEGFVDNVRLLIGTVPPH